MLYAAVRAISQDTSKIYYVASLYDLLRRAKIDGSEVQSNELSQTFLDLVAQSKQYHPLAKPHAALHEGGNTTSSANKVPDMKSPNEQFHQSELVLSIQRLLLHQERLACERRERTNPWSGLMKRCENRIVL